MAIDPDAFRPLDEIRRDITAMLGYVKSSAPREPGNEALIPYEKERAVRRRRLKEGIPIEESTWKEIVEIAASFGGSAPLREDLRERK